MSTKQVLRTDLLVLLSCVAALLIIGLIFVYSSSSVYALERFGSASYFLRKQLIGLACGIGALMILRFIPLQLVRTLTPLIFFVSLGITALTLLPGLAHRIHGSQRWLALGGFSFQPSEFLKVAYLLYVAHLLTRTTHYYAPFKQGYLPLIVALGMTSVILLNQPDFGLMITLLITTCTLLFITRMHLRYLAGTLVALMPVLAGLILLKPYRLQRVLIFLNPWIDPRGAGFQIIQSLIAIGSGSWFGVGISHSKQKFFYLPMQHTDFIFSIIAEETGFIGVLVLISIYLVLLYTGLRIASRIQDPFYALVMFGFVLLINLQAVINICVTTGLVPTKGLGLPFVSYGNTALICNLAMIGLIMNIVRNNVPRSFR